MTSSLSHQVWPSNVFNTYWNELVAVIERMADLKAIATHLGQSEMEEANPILAFYTLK